MERKPRLLVAISFVMLLIAACKKTEDLPDLTSNNVASTSSAAAVTGNVTYTLVKSSNPTSTEQAAYTLITAAMDSAVWYMNHYTTFTKALTVTYVPSVATADGNINGSIRFGSNTYYMNLATALHEIAHTVGVGTSNVWWNTLIVSGVYTGSNATQKLRTLTGNATAVLYGDSQHFWPFGLNYPTEVTSVYDYIYHCQILEAMQADGL
jgi:hypothetical protein